MKSIIVDGYSYSSIQANLTEFFIDYVNEIANYVDTTAWDTPEMQAYVENATTIYISTMDFPAILSSDNVYVSMNGCNAKFYAYVESALTIIRENAFPHAKGGEAIEIVSVLPSSSISAKKLYKLTQDMTHEGTIVPKLIGKAYTETETATEGIITHNLTTDKWYDGLTEIEVNEVEELPEASATNLGKYYYNNESLYHCELYTPIIVDYVAGLYAYESTGWKLIYSSSPTTLDWDIIRKDTLPKIQGVVVDGEKSITEYGAMTQQVAEAIFQKKEVDNKPQGYQANTVEGLFIEMDTKYSTAMRVKGDVEYYDLLPSTDLSAGDMYVVKKLYAYYNSTLDAIIGVLEDGVSTKGYLDGIKEENLVNITWENNNVVYDGNTYTKDTTKDVSLNNIYAWNSVSWFKFGSSDIDMSPYQKFEQVLDKFIIANPTLTFNPASTIAKNDNFINMRIDATLNTPITDLSSTDVKLLDAPTGITIKDGHVANLYIKTHEGTMTAMENVPDLPIGGESDVLINVFDVTKIREYYVLSLITCSHVTSPTGIGYEYDETTQKYYCDGVELTINEVTEFPSPDSSIAGNYYHRANDAHVTIRLCEAMMGAKQDYNIATGELLYDNNGMPQFMQCQSYSMVLSSGSSIEVYILDTDNMSADKANGYGSWIIGSVEAQTSGALPQKTIQVPIYRLKKITLTSNAEYIEAVRRKRSGLNVNENGVYGYYSTTESMESVKYSSHGIQNNKCREGFNGTWSFTPVQNTSKYQLATRAYWRNNSLYTSGGLTIDGFIMGGVM